MQNSYVYRRGVVLPLDDDAERALRASDVDDAVRARYLKIDDSGGFERLWDAGLFEEINARYGVLTGDYEEEFLEPGSMGRLLEAIDTMAAAAPATHPDVAGFLDKLRRLAQEAATLKRPLLFVL